MRAKLSTGPSGRLRAVGFRCLWRAAILLAATGCDRAGDGGGATVSGTAADPPAVTVPARVSPPAAGLPAVTVGPLVVDPGGFDFGVVEPDSVHEVTVELRNTGADPMTIISASPTCLCTTPDDIDGAVIPPGGSLPLGTAFHAPTGLGEKKASVRVVFRAGPVQKAASIQLRGDVSLAVRADPPYVDALSGVDAGVTQLDATDGRPFRVLSANGVEPVFADGYDPAADPPRSSYALRWALEPRGPDDCAGMRLWWVIETDRPDCPVLPLRIRHDCTGSKSDPTRRQRGWFFGEYIENLGAVRGGETVTATVHITNARKIPITGVRSLSPDADAALRSVETDEDGKTTCLVDFTPRRGDEGLLYALVMFESPNGEKEIAFVAKVVDGE